MDFPRETLRGSFYSQELELIEKDQINGIEFFFDRRKRKFGNNKVFDNFNLIFNKKHESEFKKSISEDSVFCPLC